MGEKRHGQRFAHKAFCYRENLNVKKGEKIIYKKLRKKGPISVGAGSTKFCVWKIVRN